MSDIEEYCSQVNQTAYDDEYFTVKSISRRMPVQKLDALGYGEWFYSSLLRESGYFVFQWNADTVIFRKSSDKISRKSFICDVIRDFESISKKDLVAFLMDEYGVAIEPYDVMNAIAGTGIVYDEVTGECIVTGLI